MADTRARIVIQAEDQTQAAFARVRAQLSSLQSEAASIGAAFRGIGAAVATVLGGVGITQFVRNTINGIDALNDLRDATGASIENLSGLEDVAVRTGTSFQVVGDALLKLNQALNNAKPGTELASAFNAIGVSAQELRALDPAEALLRTAQALGQFADDGEKARATQLLFGRSLREVAPLLADLRDSGGLNARVLTSQAEEAERFNKQLAALSKNATDVARAIVGDVLPALNQYLEQLNRKPGRSWLETAWQELNLELTSIRLQIVTRDIEGLTDQLTRQPNQPVLLRLLAEARQKYDELQRSAAKASEAIKGINTPGGPNPLDGPRAREDRGFTPDIPRPSLRLPNDGKDLYSPYVAGLARALVGVEKLSRAQEVGLDIAAGKLGQVNQRQQEYVLGLARAIDLAERKDPFGPYAESLARALVSVEQLSSEQQLAFDIAAGKLGEITQEQADYLRGLARAVDLAKEVQAVTMSTFPSLEEMVRRPVLALAEQSTGAQLDKLVEQTMAVRNAFEGGFVSAQEFERAIEVLGRQFGALGPELERTTDFARQAAENIQDAMGDSLLRALEGNFNSIGEMWLSLLRRMVAQALAVQLNKYLFGDYFTTGSNLGPLGSLLSWGFGARAEGGPVSAGRPYLVGERGPELIVPAASGTVVPNHALGGVTIVQHINVGSGVSRSEVFAAAVQAKEAAKNEILQMMRRGALPA